MPASHAWRQMQWVADKQDAPDRARAAAAKALAVNDQLAEAHAAFGRIKLVYERDWVGAEREFLRALELDPGDVETHIYYGHLLSFLE